MGYDQVLVLDQGRLVEQGANIFFQISQIFEIFPTGKRCKYSLPTNLGEFHVHLVSLSLGAPYKLLSSGGIFESMASAAGLRSDRSPSPHVAGL